MLFGLSPQQLFLRNIYLILFLLGANVVGLISRHYFDHGHVFGLVPLFNFDTEYNIPAFYSGAALAAASALLWSIGLKIRKQGASYISWFGLSLIFLFLAIDEIVQIHEKISDATRALLDTSGLLFFAWIIPYGVAVLAIAALYAKFIFSLPRPTMLLFVASALIFLSGALGFEVLASPYAEQYGYESLGFAIFYTCEEFLEMLGVAVFIYALLSYSSEHLGTMN